jgi:hypothetical protein
VGGWYEGSTYGQHVLSHAFTTSSLMRLYERNPAWVQRRVPLNYPAAEDTMIGMPDILHEARVGIRWLIAMQDAATGGFYSGLSAPAPPADIRVKPVYDTQPRQRLQPSQLSTAAAVAALAQAARVYSDLDPDLSLEALMVAKKGWEALEKKRVSQAHVTLPWAGELELYRQPVQPYYREGFWYQQVTSITPYLVWAALELGETTSSTPLKAFAQQQWATLDAQSTGLSWQSPLWRIWENPIHRESVPQEAKATYLDFAKKTLPWTRVLQTPFVSPYEFKEYPLLPASNDAWVRHALLWMQAYRETQDDVYLKAALDVYNYLMGFNQWDAVMMSGSKASRGNLPLQSNPCNLPLRSAGAGVPGFLLKGITPQYPKDVPFQDNSTLCQWTATHISWQGNLAELMFDLDTHYNPDFVAPLTDKDEDVQKLKRYNEFEEDELRRTQENMEKQREKSGPKQMDATPPEASPAKFKTPLPAGA